MIWKIEFGGGGPEDVIVTTFGVASRNGFFGFNLELVSDFRWRPGMAVLIDHTALDTSELTGSDIEAIADLLVELDGRLGPALAAVVTPDAYTSGVADVSIRFASAARFRARTFPSHREAAAWIRAERPATA